MLERTDFDKRHFKRVRYICIARRVKFPNDLMSLRFRLWRSGVCVIDRGFSFPNTAHIHTQMYTHILTGRPNLPFWHQTNMHCISSRNRQSLLGNTISRRQKAMHRNGLQICYCVIVNGQNPSLSSFPSCFLPLPLSPFISLSLSPECIEHA